MVATKTIKKLERDWRAALRREENETDLAKSWRLAAATDSALRRLRAAQAGVTLPMPNTARNRAKAAFAALASIGKTIARAVSASKALAKARAALAAKKVAKLVTSMLRRVVSTVATIALASNLEPKKETEMAGTVKATITAVDTNGTWGGKSARLVRYECEDGTWAWVPGSENVGDVIDVDAIEAPPPSKKLFRYCGIFIIPKWETKRRVAGGECVDVIVNDIRSNARESTVNVANISEYDAYGCRCREPWVSTVPNRCKTCGGEVPDFDETGAEVAS